MSIKLKAKTVTKHLASASHGEFSDLLADTQGRLIISPYQVRDLIVTAYAEVTSGTPTTLLAGNAGYFLDLMQISFSTSSTVASTNVLLTDDSTKVLGVDVPISDTTSVSYLTPFPQGAKGGTWRIDMEDVTGTTLYVTALFVKNV